jgi:glutamyl-tRNA synthetase
MREGVKTLIELIDISEFFYIVPDYKEINRSIIEDSKNILENFNANLGSFSFESHETLEADVKNYIKDNDLKFPQIGKPLRIILSGRENAPSISELIYLLGKKETSKRIASFL